MLNNTDKKTYIKVRPILLKEKMAELDITTMSSKGQIVIPQSMRKDYHPGERFIIIKADKQIILKTTTSFDKNIEEDLKFAHKTEKAWKDYEQGKFKSMPINKFLEKIEQC